MKRLEKGRLPRLYTCRSTTAQSLSSSWTGDVGLKGDVFNNLAPSAMAARSPLNCLLVPCSQCGPNFRVCGVLFSCLLLGIS